MLASPKTCRRLPAETTAGSSTPEASGRAGRRCERRPASLSFPTTSSPVANLDIEEMQWSATAPRINRSTHRRPRRSRPDLHAGHQTQRQQRARRRQQDRPGRRPLRPRPRRRRHPARRHQDDQRLYDGASTRELDQLSIQTAASLIVEETCRTCKSCPTSSSAGSAPTRWASRAK